MWGTDVLRLPSRRLAPVRVRPAAVSDFEACREIYRRNEPNRFPQGHADNYREHLESGSSLVLVAEDESGIVATGGIDIRQMRGWWRGAHLSYGMVLPEHQGKGIGTVMLLARLALLPPPGAGRWTVTMTSVAGSDSFYRRYGFRDTGQRHGSEDQKVLFAAMAPGDGQTIRRLFAAGGVRLDADGARVPVTEVDAAEVSGA